MFPEYQLLMNKTGLLALYAILGRLGTSMDKDLDQRVMPHAAALDFEIWERYATKRIDWSIVGP